MKYEVRSTNLEVMDPGSYIWPDASGWNLELGIWNFKFGILNLFPVNQNSIFFPFYHKFKTIAAIGTV